MTRSNVISSGVQPSREIYLEIDLSIPLSFSRDDGCFVKFN